jgi:hypothetical protein
MNKFDKIFLTGLTLIGTPILLIILMSTLSIIGPKKDKDYTSVDKKVVYDTVKVKKIFYDTIRVNEKKPKKTEVKEEVRVEETKKDSL